MKRSSLALLFSFMVIFSLVLSACGSEDYATDQPYYSSDNATEPPTNNTGGNSDAIGPDITNFGFDVNQNGFSFENYDSQQSNTTDLTPVEVRRMFGDQVCAQINGDTCVLTPPAQQWMEQMNGDMSSGHCEGMAVLSMLMYTGQDSAAQFGGSDAYDLSLSDEALQREIAYWWATQATDPTASNAITGTPMEILDYVKNMSVTGETYTIGITKPDGSGGHAITPIGVEDKGDGLYAILVYDNNWPGQTRELLIDSRDNSWTYEAAVNTQTESEVYSGNADTQTLQLTPTSVRLQPQDCPFCGNDGYSSVNSKLAAPAQQLNQIYLDGDGHILITDDNGNRLGYVNGTIVNEIAGANYHTFYMADASGNTPEPIYSVPADLNVTVTIDGSTLTQESATDLVMIGHGFSFGVEGIALQPGQVDTAYFYPSEETIAYETESDQSPNIVIGIENPQGEADYYFEAQGTDINGGGIITAYLDTQAGNLQINAEKLNNAGSFDFYMTRITDTLEDQYSAEGIALKEGAVVYIDYAQWTNASPNGMYFGVDLNGDGVIDDEYTVDNSQP